MREFRAKLRIFDALAAGCVVPIDSVAAGPFDYRVWHESVEFVAIAGPYSFDVSADVHWKDGGGEEPLCGEWGFW